MAHALDAAAIRSGLAARGEAMAVEVLERCGSTNALLLAADGSTETALLLADEQTEGRGRRGRKWHAAPGSALLFSLRWKFESDLASLRGLSLAAGVSVARTLSGLGAKGIALKWPNDVLVCRTAEGEPLEAKLGGILVETRSSGRRIAAVIGIGLNYRREPGLESRLGRRVAALEDVTPRLPSRNELAVSLVAALAQDLREFADSGLAPFKASWESLHAHQGTSLRVRTGDGRVVSGIAEGIAVDGALLLRNRRGLHSIHSGSVLRGGAHARAERAAA